MLKRLKSLEIVTCNTQFWNHPKMSKYFRNLIIIYEILNSLWPILSTNEQKATKFGSVLLNWTSLDIGLICEVAPLDSFPSAFPYLPLTYPLPQRARNGLLTPSIYGDVMVEPKQAPVVKAVRASQVDLWRISIKNALKEFKRAKELDKNNEKRPSKKWFRYKQLLS